jgi:hypothetical protein
MEKARKKKVTRTGLDGFFGLSIRDMAIID